jgi:hypothetical protein
VKAVSAGAADKAGERAGAGGVLERDCTEDGVQEVIGEATEPVVLILRGSALAPTVRRGSPTGPPPAPRDQGHGARGQPPGKCAFRSVELLEMEIFCTAKLGGSHIIFSVK